MRHEIGSHRRDKLPHRGLTQLDSGGNSHLVLVVSSLWFTLMFLLSDHSLDTDSTRASNLGAFAKPIRGALKTQKAVVWQRRTYSNSNEWDGATGSLPGSSSASMKSEKVIKLGDNSDSLIRNDASQSMDSNANGVRDRVPTKGYQNAVWMETQPIEEDESTWDRVGDMDYKEKVEKRRK